MKSLLFGAALAAATSITSASASTVTVAYQPDGIFGPNNLSQKITVTTPGPGYDGNVSAGLFHLTGDNGVGDFFAFCVDLLQAMKDPTEYTVDAGLFSGTVLSNIDKLFTSALGGVALHTVIDTSLEAAGMQVALWEIVNDSDMPFDLTSGNFSVSGNAAVQGQAQDYLDGLVGAQTGAFDIQFYASSTQQDVVTIAAVPLPASGILAAFGVGGLIALRRRKTARKS
ncbi:MAG: VPLPA-CTERM sorting domain-containing protein [Sedimentitalea sp.]